ncbi:MAG: SPOR domain-containing protein [Candidatus Aminicenantes bacterium]|nr:SPOR domain-containing protein [Candidatus Aminicenantes bacterium]
MSDREYRELQLSSTHLLLIFVGLFAVLIVVFLLGISVGKKQSEEIQKTQLTANPPIESVQTNKPRPSTKTEEDVPPPVTRTETKKPPIEKVTAEQAPAVQPKKTEPTPVKVEPQPGNYYIQVGAYSKKDGAMALAQDFQSKGYPTKIIDPLSTDRRAIFRVRVGGYASREEANRILAELLPLMGKKEGDYFVKFVN